MNVKIVMNSGTEYVVETSFLTVKEYTDKFKNHLGVVISGFVELKTGIFINPSNISAIEMQ